MRSLRAQLLVTYGLTLVLIVGLVSGGLATWLNWNGSDIGRRGLTAQSERLARCLQSFPGQSPRFEKSCDFFWIYEAAPQDLKYRLLSATGEVLLSSDADGISLDKTSAPHTAQPFKVSVAGIPMRALNVPIETGGTAMTLQVARSERAGVVRLPASGFPVGRAVLLVLGSLLVFGIVVSLTLRKMLRPIREVSHAASKIEPRSLSTRLTPQTLPTELEPLIEAFNLALDRLQSGYKAQQELLENIAHELKTPLALIRGQIEMEDRPDRASLLVDVDFMARQIHQLLHLAEVSGPQNYAFKSVDLVAVAEEVVVYMSRLADRSSIILKVVSPPEQVVVADYSAIFMLIKNLVENAIQHSPADGVVLIDVGNRAVTVSDSGDGVSPADFQHLFKRFWKTPKSPGKGGGAGLGLAICQEIAQAHGWALSARNLEPGVAFELAIIQR